jgi:hypothetical protein
MKYMTPRDIPQYQASGRERLEALAAFVEGLSADWVSFANWRSCIVGLAAKDPWFVAQGLSLEYDERVGECRPAYAGRTDWMAVSKFFEIGVDNARQLLDPSGYNGELHPSRSVVAHKLRSHLASVPVTPMIIVTMPAISV